ncbi:hypothetical protein, partial [Frankia sp. Cj3]
VATATAGCGAGGISPAVGVTGPAATASPTGNPTVADGLVAGDGIDDPDGLTDGLRKLDTASDVTAAESYLFPAAASTSRHRKLAPVMNPAVRRL